MEIQLFSFFCVIPGITIFTNFIFILVVVNFLLVKQTYLPFQHLALNLTLNLNPSYSPSHREILPTSLLHKRRGVQLSSFSRGTDLDRRLRFYKSQILPWSTTLLKERHARIFWIECSLFWSEWQLLPNICQVLYMAWHPLFVLDTTIERNFNIRCNIFENMICNQC